MATSPTASEADLRAAPRDGRKRELVDGEIRVSPAGFRHEEIALRLMLRLAPHVLERGLGKVVGSSAGFRLPNGNVRSPDVSFVAAGRFPGDRSPETFADLAPDLAVEIVSPDDRPRDLLDKVGESLEAGVRLVWVVDPRRGAATVYRSLTDVRSLDRGGSLDGGDVVPGFTMPLSDLVA